MSLRVLRRAARLALLPILITACGKTQQPAPPPPPPPEVAIVTVQPRTIPVTFEYVGQTAGAQEVEVRSRVSGILTSWNYEEGKVVRKGQSLFTIDPAPFRTALVRAEATLAGTQARLSQARREIERLTPLLEKGMVARKVFDDAVATEEVAAAEVKAAEAALEQTRLDLAYTRVEAPLNGVTSRALKSIGSLVEAQQTLLTTISQVDPIHVVFAVSESDHLRLAAQAGSGRLVLPRGGHFEASVRLSDGTTYARSGKVDFADVRINPATGASEMRAVLPNPDQDLRPGQFVRVRLDGASIPSALAVPQRAVLEGPQGKLVLVVNGASVVEPRPIQVGQWAGDEWIVESGLKAGDRVIVDGVIKAPPGTTVKATPLASTQAAATAPVAAAQSNQTKN
ncbi:MAG: efflux RND transporter periplasmic adaptor subunit [Burkholderiales bacterium]|nr:efflux RND transporter periplasmic adaptor subunit [Burkholderiales bacterium]